MANQQTTTITAKKNVAPAELQGHLKTNGAPYKVIRLGLEHAAAAKAMHDNITASLNEDEKNFILPKLLEFFEDLLGHSRKGAIFGVISEDKLIGMAVVLTPAHKNHCMAGLGDIAKARDVAILQSVCVLPEFRGNALMDDLVHQSLLFAQQKGLGHTVARVKTKNIPSWNCFLKNGFNIVSAEAHPHDGAPVYNMHEKTDKALTKPLAPFFEKTVGSKTSLCPKDNTHKQQKLFNNGYQCVGYRKASQTMVFVK